MRRGPLPISSGRGPRLPIEEKTSESENTMGVPEEPVRATAAFEFAPEDFPIVIEYLHAGEVILTSLLTGPGTLHVPSKSELGVDGKVDVRVTTAREESYTQV